MAEWLGCRTWNPKVAGSSPALTTKLELFLGRPWFNSSVMLVNSQLGFLTVLFSLALLVSLLGFTEMPH